MNRALSLALVVFACLLTVGCFEQHGQDGTGVRCGPTTCSDGEVCCNESCGICTAPGEGCIALFCEDAGPVDPPACRDDSERRCLNCDGEAVCVPFGASCPTCPPERCGASEALCFSCDTGEEYCAPAGACPGCDRPPECYDSDDCGEGEFCDAAACGAQGLCLPRPDGCDLLYAPVCGCDGVTYGNTCVANSAGVGIAADGECAPAPEACAGQGYCGCEAESGCEPLVDLSTGCICDCEAPFSCVDTLPACDCFCGGATYLGCAPVGQCDVTETECPPGVTATVGPDGCPQCGT